MNEGVGRMSTAKKERIGKSHRQGQEGIPWEHMGRDHGISKHRAFYFNGTEDKWTKLERKPRDSKYWYRRLSGVTIVYQRHVLKIWDIYITELYYRPNRQEILEVEPEGEVYADEIGAYIFQNEVEKDIKELRYKKATRGDVPGDVLKLSGKMGWDWWYNWRTICTKLESELGFHWSYSACLKEEAKSCILEWPSYMQQR